MQWILLSENWSPLTVLPPSIRRAGDLCRPQPTREQCAYVSFHPAISFSLTHTGCTVYEVLSPVQSADWRLLPLTPPGSLAFAAKPQCRPLTWWMVLDNKTLGFTFSPSCHADNTRPARLQTLCAHGELFTFESTRLQRTGPNQHQHRENIRGLQQCYCSLYNNPFHWTSSSPQK